MKAVELDKVIELSRRSIKLQIEQLTTLDRVFIAMEQHLANQRKRNHLPKLVSVNGEVSNDGR
jgi:hypothetical protein